MAEPLLDLDDFHEYARAVTILYALYADRRDVADKLLDPFKAVEWHHLPQWVKPSWAVWVREGAAYVAIAGTTNGVQIYKHGSGFFAHHYKGGGVNSTWDDVAVEMWGELRHYLDPGKVGKVTIVGHSYGAAVAQVVAAKAIDAGRASDTLTVYSIGSPKPFTDTADTSHLRLRSLLNHHDPVTVFPPSFARVWYPDPLTGLIPYPWPFDSWEHKGHVAWMQRDGGVTDDWWDPAEGVSEDEPDWLTFNSHSLNEYSRRLEAYRVKQGWEPSPAYLTYRESLAVVSKNGTLSDLDKALKWHPGWPFNHEWGLTWDYYVATGAAGNGVGFASKGLNAMICRVKVYISCHGFGWSDEHYVEVSGGGMQALEAARDEVLAHYQKRIDLEKRNVFGVHWNVDAVRVQDVANTKLVRTFWEVKLKAGKEDADKLRGTEWPFVVAMSRLWDDTRTVTRTHFYRPLPDDEFREKGGLRVLNLDTKLILEAIWKAYIDQTVFRIRAIDRSAPKYTAAQAFAPSPTPGVVTLVLGAHTIQAGQKVAIRGGDPEHKPLRGTYRVLTVDTTSISYRPKGIPEELSGGVEVQPVVYTYKQVKEALYVKITHRDVGRPIAQGRGRQ